MTREDLEVLQVAADTLAHMQAGLLSGAVDAYEPDAEAERCRSSRDALRAIIARDTKGMTDA